MEGRYGKDCCRIKLLHNKFLLRLIWGFDSACMVLKTEFSVLGLHAFGIRMGALPNLRTRGRIRVSGAHTSGHLMRRRSGSPGICPSHTKVCGTRPVLSGNRQRQTHTTSLSRIVTLIDHWKNIGILQNPRCAPQYLQQKGKEEE